MPGTALMSTLDSSSTMMMCGGLAAWRWLERLELQPLDQAGVDQQPIEAPRLRSAATGIEQSLAALENPLLLGKRGIERQAGGLLHDQRKIGSVDGLERGRRIDRFEVDRVDRVIGGEVARVARHQTPVDRDLVERRLEDGGGEIGLVVAVAHQQKGFARELVLEAGHEVRVVAEAHSLPAQIFVDL